MARVHVAAWRAAYAGIVPEHVLAGLSVDGRAERWAAQLREGGVQVCVAAGPDVLGFAAAGDSRDADLPGAGELYALYVAPEQWGQGLGQRLFDASSAWLASRYPTGHLWVLAANARARRFYGRQGWAPDGTEKHEDRGGHVLHEVRLVVEHDRVRQSRSDGAPVRRPGPLP